MDTAFGTVRVTHDSDPNLDVSLTAFLLTESGKVSGDEGIVFYNQPIGMQGVATFIEPKQTGKTITHTLDFDLRKCPAHIHKIAVALTENNLNGFAKVSNLKAVVDTGGTTILLEPSSFSVENGIVILELYLRNGQPKIKSIWRGFATGLDGLCKNFGVEVADQAANTNDKIKKTLEQEVVHEPMITLSGEKLKKVTGTVNLSKGQKPVIIEKTKEIIASVSWASGTDYDIYALVYTKDGRQVDVAMFEADGVAALANYQNGAVQHMGDVGNTSNQQNTEMIKIRLNPDIIAVVPVVYSAQSNGTGSFYRYKVSMKVDNQKGTGVIISADNANNNDRIYTCVPGMILNTSQGVVVEALEYYSKPNSERRPKLAQGDHGTIKVLMDKGPNNKYKGGGGGFIAKLFGK